MTAKRILAAAQRQAPARMESGVSRRAGLGFLDARRHAGTTT